MARSLPLVVTPLLKAAEREGVDLMLVSVEVWPDEVFVRARGLPSELTDRLDREFHDDLDRWRQQGADERALPQQPAERIFDIDLSVVDDVGTTYTPTSSSRGGSGTMFRAEWCFVPGPPGAARSLVVRVGGSDTRIELDLDAQPLACVSVPKQHGYCPEIIESMGVPSEPVAVRLAEMADCREIAEVHVETWRAAYQHAFPPEVLEELSVDEREARWRERIEDESAVVWVAKVQGRVVGFASVGPSRTDEDAGELYSIYVLPAAWGSGAARELMARARAWFAKEGYVTAMLWVLADNPRARRFYEREGWTPEGTRVDAVRGVNVEEALYRLIVGG